MTKNEDWTVGREVVFDGPYNRRGKIAKVYKNGNIVLEGSKQQYRVWGDIANETGGDRWSSYGTIRLVTPELEAENQEKAAIRASRDLAWKLSDRLRPNCDYRRVQADMQALLDKLSAGDTA